MSWMGMNLETVSGEIPKWSNLSEEIQGIISNTNTQVQAANEAWNGPDSEQFVSEWQDKYQPALTSIKDMIDALVNQLTADVNQQRETSGA